MNRIQSKNHNIRTYRNKKVSLTCYDDNIYIFIYILKDGYSRFSQIYSLIIKE